MLSNALEIQEKLNALQRELHEALILNDENLKQAQAKIFDEREKVIQQWTKSECRSSPGSSSEGSSLSMNFWAKAIISALELYDKESPENIHFLGPYDAELLTKYLVSMKLNFLPHSQKLLLNFKENPFFEETVLWAELHYPLEEPEPEKKVKHKTQESNKSQSEEEEEEEDDDDEEHWTFSGVTWKPGYGPQDEEEDEEEEDAEKQEKSGSKRKRDESSEKSSPSKENSVVGPSMLGVFSVMPPHPNNDPEFLEKLEEELKEEDMDEEEAEAAMEEELAEAVDSWESEMDHREQLLSLLIEDIYTNPVEAILVGKADETEVPPAQKSKSE